MGSKFLLTIYTLKSCVGTQSWNFKRFLLTTQTDSSLSVSSLVRYSGTSFQGTPSAPRLAWDQAPHGGVGGEAKRGSNRKNIGERSEPSGGLGRGKELSPPQTTYRLASLADFLFRPQRIFFSFFSQCRAWSQARPKQVSLE